MSLTFNPADGTITTEGGGGITLTPAASTQVTINEGILLPDGSVSSPAIRFSDDLNCGIYSPTNDVIGFSGHGVDAFRIVGVASAVNYLSVSPSATGNALTVTANGTDTDIDIDIVPKGAGEFTVNGSPVGGGGGAVAYLYTDTPATDPVGTGAGSLVIGDGANGYTGIDSITIGNGARSVGGYSGRVCIGKDAYSNRDDTVSICTGAQCTSVRSIAIGKNSSAEGDGRNTALGYGARVSSGQKNIALGDFAYSSAIANAISIGASSSTTGTGGIAIGRGASSAIQGVAIGDGASAAAYSMELSCNYSGAKIQMESTGVVKLVGSAAQFKAPSYTVATLPTGSTGGVIFVSDETGGATLAFYDGTNWRRVSDLAVVS